MKMLLDKIIDDQINFVEDFRSCESLSANHSRHWDSSSKIYLSEEFE